MKITFEFKNGKSTTIDGDRQIINAFIRSIDSLVKQNEYQMRCVKEAYSSLSLKIEDEEYKNNFLNDGKENYNSIRSNWRKYFHVLKTLQTFNSIDNEVSSIPNDENFDIEFF
jgi:hypothetical protein